MDSNTTAGSVDRIGELELEVRALNARLEVSLRRTRRIAILAVCAIVVPVVAGGASFVRDQFTRMEILGPNNDVRIAMNVNAKDSSAGIALNNAEGKRVLLLGVDPQGTPEIVFFDPTGTKIAKAIQP